MTNPGYSRADASGAGNREPAAIIGVDLQTRTATAMLRSKYTVNVNTSYAVGESFITPAIGEQWYIERFDMEWRLVSRIPYNDPTLNIEPELGQVSVGASGPLELNGTEIRSNNIFRIGDTYFKTNDSNGKLEYSLDKTSWAPVGGAGGGGGGIDSTDDLPEGSTNKYFTNTRAADAAPVQTVAGRTGDVTLTKSDVGLNNVDNTSDSSKPISSATATALGSKADLVSGVVPDDQLPIPRVLEFDELADFPAPGEESTLYIAADTGSLYWWSGVNFELLVSGSGTLSSTDELPEGLSNLYFTEERAADAAPVQDDDARLTNQRVPTDNSVTSAKIVDGAIVNADINASAAIALSKLATGRVEAINETGSPFNLTIRFITEADWLALDPEDRDPTFMYVVLE